MSFFGTLTSVLNPVNQVKALAHAADPRNQARALWGIASNPFNPLKQTNALANLFRPGSGSSGRPSPYTPPPMPPMPPVAPPPMMPPQGFPPPGSGMDASPLPQAWGGMPSPGGPPPTGYDWSTFQDRQPAGYVDPSAFVDDPSQGWGAAYGE